MKIGQVDLQSLLPKSSSEAQQERTWQEEVEDDICSFLPSLTFQERVVGCLFCMLFGYVLSIGSWFRFKRLLFGDPCKYYRDCFIKDINKFITALSNQPLPITYNFHITTISAFCLSVHCWKCNFTQWSMLPLRPTSTS